MEPKSSTQSKEVPSIRKEIPDRLLRQLLDKNYERRKQAGNELQKVMKYLIEEKQSIGFQQALEFFNEEYFQLNNENCQKAGLMAYSALAAYCSEPQLTLEELDQLLEPVLVCTRDGDNKIRYYAIETLYNIVKSCRQQVLIRFSELFITLIHLFNTSDNDIKRASERINNLLKTVLVEYEADAKYFDSTPFIEIMKETLLEADSPHTQQLILN